MADNTLNFDLDAPAVPTLTALPAPPKGEPLANRLENSARR